MAGLTVYEVHANQGKVLKVIDVTFDSSYPTGGEVITPADCGLSSIDMLVCEQASGYMVQYVAGKLVVRTATGAHTHVTNAAATYTQSEVSAASTAAAATQVGNTVSLATLTLRILAIGTA